ncbi:MAG: universal stress protein [Thioalkalispiraceae bacterium]|jgi:nucleotide-binding universal stress UspA family protein
MNETTIKHILVALDSSDVNQGILQTATLMANRLNAQLNAMFVEDINLLRLAELPFVREMVYGTAKGRQINPVEMERALRAQTTRLRELVETIAEQQNIKIKFDVLRGDIAPELCSASKQVDLLIVGKSAETFRRSQKIGSVTKTILTSASCSILILQNNAAIERPVAVLFTGSETSRKALQFGFQLAQHDHNNLVVIFPAVAKGEYSRLQKEVSKLTQDFDVTVPVVSLPVNSAESLLEVLADSGSRVLVLESRQEVLDESQTQLLIEQNAVPVVLIS